MAGQRARVAPTLACIAAFAMSSAASSAALAQPAEPYAGKTVTVVIGFGPGGGYDLWGRTLARHIGKHLPGKPTVIAQNMPGAGSFVATNHIYTIAPKDGTVIGIVARDAPLGPITGAEGAKFDATKLSWIGTPTIETNVCMAFHTAGVKTVQDLYQKQLIVGDTGPGTGTYTYPRALTQLLGMKFKAVSGFPSSSDVFLAMERGEVEGFCESLDSVMARRPDWIPTKKVLLLFQGGAEPNPEIKDVPFILDLAKTEEDRQAISFLYAGQGIGRPFIAPPDLPADRLKILRDAFNATMKDPDFVADVKRQKLDLEPEDGEHLEALIKRIYATPKPIVEQVGKLIK